jgi:hypothetical protein
VETGQDPGNAGLRARDPQLANKIRAWEGLASLSPFRLLEFSEAGREGGKQKIQVENRVDTHLRLVYFDVIPNGVLFAVGVLAGLMQVGAFSKLPHGSVSNTLGALCENTGFGGVGLVSLSD